MQERREISLEHIPPACWPILEHVEAQPNGYAREDELPQSLRNEDVFTVLEHGCLVSRGGSVLRGEGGEVIWRTGPSIELTDSGRAALALRRMRANVVPDSAADEGEGRIGRRLSARHAELAIQVLRKLRAHNSPQLTAGQLDSIELSSKTVYSASRNWKRGTDYFGDGTASRIYATSRVTAYVLEQWTPKPRRDSNRSR